MYDRVLLNIRRFSNWFKRCGKCPFGANGLRTVAGGRTSEENCFHTVQGDTETSRCERL